MGNNAKAIENTKSSENALRFPGLRRSHNVERKKAPCETAKGSIEKVSGLGRAKGIPLSLTGQFGIFVFIVFMGTLSPLVWCDC